MQKARVKADFEKFKALFLYICEKTENDPDFGAVKLNKILYFADFRQYQRTGKPITGETYVKRQFGPAPKRLLIAQRELVEEGKIAVRDVESFPVKRREFVALQPANVSKYFTADEISLVDDLIEGVTHQFTASEISEITHDDIWGILQLGEDIPYDTVFASQTGEIDESDIEWAKERGLV